MAEQKPSVAFHETKAFFDEHGRAGQLLLTAAHDYASARCLLQNHLLPGLALGAQSIEKTLKAHLLLLEPTRNVRSFSHKLSSLLDKVIESQPALMLAQFAPVARNSNDTSPRAIPTITTLPRR